MNYIVYNKHGLMLARFETEKEGRDFLELRAAQWRAAGMPGEVPLLRLCYNGAESVEVAKVGQ